MIKKFFKSNKAASFYVIASIIFIYTQIEAFKFRGIENWPSALAYDLHLGNGSSSTNRIPWRFGEQTVFIGGSNYIHYKFKVQNKEFTGSHYIKQSELNALGPNEIPVFYKPEDPEVSRINNSYSANKNLLIILYVSSTLALLNLISVMIGKL